MERPARSGGGLAIVHASPILAPLLAAYRAGRGLLVVLDYDGTLTPIVADPSRAVLDPRVRVDLRRLCRMPRVRVAVISGRDLDDVRRHVRLPEVLCVGCHGLQMEAGMAGADGPQLRAHGRQLDAARQRLHPLAASVPGLRLESKTLGLTLHVRGIDAATTAALEGHVRQALNGTELQLLVGKDVLDIVSRGWTKGDAALALRAQVFGGEASGTALLFIGDDTTDELAFARLREVAVTVKIGAEVQPTAAHHRLPDVGAVHALLRRLVAAGRPA